MMHGSVLRVIQTQARGKGWDRMLGAASTHTRARRGGSGAGRGPQLDHIAAVGICAWSRGGRLVGSAARALVVAFAAGGWLLLHPHRCMQSTLLAEPGVHAIPCAVVRDGGGEGE